MYPAIDQNLDRIRSELKRRGLTFEPLMEDLLDHVCCMIEVQMGGGIDFETSYHRVLGQIGSNQLPEIQHQTLLNLDKNHQRMKNFTYLFGLASALVTILGSIFKRMHWPGAGILITVGIIFIVVVFLPLYFFISYREQSEKKNPVYPIVGYLTLALLLAGALFKIMHWPGANYLVQSGLAILLIGFVPLYMVNAFQRGGKEKVRLPYLVMLIVGIAIVILFSRVSLTREAVDLYVEESIKADQNIHDIEARTLKLVDLSLDSISSGKQDHVRRIHDKAEELQSKLDAIREMLLSAVNQTGTSIDQVAGKDRTKKLWIDDDIFVAEDEFLSEARAFLTMIEDMLLDPVLRVQIDGYMDFTRKIWKYTNGDHFSTGEPLVVNYYLISRISREVALAEYVSIQYIVEH